MGAGTQSLEHLEMNIGTMKMTFFHPGAKNKSSGGNVTRHYETGASKQATSRCDDAMVICSRMSEPVAGSSGIVVSFVSLTFCCSVTEEEKCKSTWRSNQRRAMVVQFQAACPLPLHIPRGTTWSEDNTYRCIHSHMGSLYYNVNFAILTQWDLSKSKQESLKMTNPV